ncbi:MAG TPA: hypothetical protein VM695_00515 [Phycisphaerae bacterium]|nr:hypothetical protein [Phycisphaerae bacterium]
MIPRATARGHALIGTMIFLVLSMLLFAGMCQHVGTHLRVEKALKVRTEQSDRLKGATAWGIGLLETGEPPLNFLRMYRCRMVLDGEVYLTTYVKTSVGEEPPSYLMSVRRMDPSYSLYPLAPDSFGE